MDKTARKEYMRRYRLENKAGIKAYNLKNKERIQEKGREYRHLNRATLILKSRAYNAEHRNELNEANRNHYQQHKGERDLYHRTGEQGRRSKIRKADRKWFVYWLGKEYMSKFEVHHSWSLADNASCQLLTKEEHLALELAAPCELIGNKWVEVYC